MALLFENRYTVSREDGVKFHTCAPGSEAAPRKKRGGIIRGVGLCAAGVIMVMSFFTDTPVFFFVGLLLAVIYIFRIINSRDVSSASKAPPQFTSHEFKWIRIIRFDSKIHVIDPQLPEEFEYDSVVKMTEDSAYATLWLNSGDTVRVSKNGFTTGTWEGFQSFMCDIIGRGGNYAAEE